MDEEGEKMILSERKEERKSISLDALERKKKYLSWIKNTVSKKKQKVKPEKELSNKVFQNNIIDQLINEIDKEHFSMNKRSVKNLNRSSSVRTNSVKFNPTQNKVDFNDFINFAKNGETRGTLIKSITHKKPRVQEKTIDHSDSISKITMANEIKNNLLKINGKKKLKKIFLVITWCQYLKRYTNKFGLDPKVLNDIFHNEEKDRISKYMTRENFEDNDDLHNKNHISENFPSYLINPDKMFSKTWNIIMFFLMIYIVLIGSFRVCMTDSYLNPKYSTIFIFDMFIECIYFIDIIINFLTAYRNSKDELVTDICKIAKNYSKTWLFVDLLSQFPYYIFDWASDTSKLFLIKI